jgi:hypothetical protein
MDKNFAPKFFTFLSPFRSNFVGSFNGFRDVRPCQIGVLMDFVTVKLYPNSRSGLVIEGTFDAVPCRAFLGTYTVTIYTSELFL